jgi:uncharacterized protein (TIGR02147 family)
MQSVKNYLEYRDFLRDFYNDKKEASPYFSYRYMGAKLSIDASHLVKIFQKQRHINSKSIDCFIDFCGLTGTDAEYFSSLVCFNKAKSDRDIKQHYERLLALRGVKAYTLGKQQYEYYQKWYYSTILTLLDFYPFTGNYKKLAARLDPPITEAQARKAIRLLKTLGLVTRRANGTLELTNKIVTSGEGCPSVAVKTFQEETMKLAVESLHRHGRQERNISTVTITAAKKDLEQINEIIEEFRSSLLKFAADAKTPDTVYQLNIQLFPVTQP